MPGELIFIISFTIPSIAYIVIINWEAIFGNTDKEILRGKIIRSLFWY